MCDKPSSTLSFQTQAPTLPRFSQMVNIQIQLDSGSRSRYYLRKIKNRGENSGTLIFDADPWTWFYIIRYRSTSTDKYQRFKHSISFFSGPAKKEKGEDLKLGSIEDSDWGWAGLAAAGGAGEENKIRRKVLIGLVIMPGISRALWVEFEEKIVVVWLFKVSVQLQTLQKMGSSCANQKWPKVTIKTWFPAAEFSEDGVWLWQSKVTNSEKKV